MVKKCQVDIRPPESRRRIQVSMTDQKTVKTVSTGVQCSCLSDGVSLRIAAGLVPQPEKNDSDSDKDDRGDNYPDYDPLDQTKDVKDYHHGSDTLRSDSPPLEERQFIVSESYLPSILWKCDLREEPCEPFVPFTRGTMNSFHKHKWTNHTVGEPEMSPCNAMVQPSPGW